MDSWRRLDEWRGTASRTMYFRGFVSCPLLTVAHANAVRMVAKTHEAAGRGAAALKLWREAIGLYAAASLQVGVDECAARIDALGP